MFVRWTSFAMLLPLFAVHGGTPVEFAPGIISTGHEFTVTFTPDGHEVFFTRSGGTPRWTHVMHAVLGKDGWQAAEPVSFSGDAWADLDPALSPDGKRLYFISTRPRPGAAAPAKPDMDIWYVDREGSSWGAPHWIESLSSDAKEGSPTMDRDGTLCFFSDRGAEPNHNAIYCAKPVGASWSTPTKLNANVNAGPSDTSPFLSRDGQTMLFYSERTGGSGKADLYVSRKKNGDWQPAANLGSTVNSAEFEYNPSVSPDGSTFYFGRQGRVWTIPTAELDQNVIRAGMFR